MRERGVPIGQVAFIGLGRMGRLMAANLEAAGHAVQSFDLDGSGNRPTAREAAAGVPILVTMLPDGKAVQKAVKAASPAAGTIVVDMSSSDPADTRRLGVLLKRKKIRLLDAPVSGSVKGAREGALAIMVGGDAADLATVIPVLKAMGEKIFHCGPLGAGHAMKALNNYIGGSGTIAAFEALIVGRKFGLDPHLMVEILNASTGYNSTTQRKIPQQVLTNAFASGFSAALMTKDIGIAAKIARAVKVPAPYLRKTSALWDEALRRLPKGADHTEIYHFLERIRPGAGRRRPAPARRRARRSPARTARVPAPSRRTAG